MLPNTEQYVNHRSTLGMPLKYMGKLRKGMNTNEYVRLNPDISILILSLLWPADGHIKDSSVAPASFQLPCLLKPDPECHLCISEADLSVEGHWPHLTADKHWRFGIWKSCMCVTFAKKQWLITHCTPLCKQTVGNVFFVCRKVQPQAGINHENKMEKKMIYPQ